MNNIPLLIITAAAIHFPVAEEVLLSRFNIRAAGTQNPDLHWLNTDNFADANADDDTKTSGVQIADVRKMSEEIVMSPYSAPQSFFILLHLDFSSIPAQNALLKVLEEPPQHAQIILTANSLAKVLPTVQSRCEVVYVANSESADSEENVAELAVKTEELYSTIMKEKISGLIALSEKYKEREEAVGCLQNLIQFLQIKNQANPTGLVTKQLQTLLTAIEYLEKNVNVRLVLEDAFFKLR
jgi:DNA polymerase III delta prime subunit